MLHVLLPDGWTYWPVECFEGLNLEQTMCVLSWGNARVAWVTPGKIGIA